MLDTATLEVSYRMEWLRRPDREKPMQDLLLLQAGGKVTKFFSYKTLQRDSLLRITPAEQVLANVGNFKGRPGGRRIPELPRRRDDLHRQDLTGQHALHRAAAEIEWTLRDRTREVIGYDCRRATCRFRGAITKPGTPRSSRSPPAPGNSTGCRTDPGRERGDDGGIIRFEATGIRRAEVPVTMADLNYLTTSRKKNSWPPSANT